MSDNTFLHSPAQPKNSKIIVDILQALVIALVLIVVSYLFIITPNQVDGKSMEPNFHDGEFIFVNRTVQFFGNTSLGKRFDYDYKRGDSIIFKKDSEPKALIKRIIAAPGDTIKLEDFSYYVNGKRIDEDYIPDSFEYQTELPDNNLSFLGEGVEVVVPPNKYFVSGDNRKNSLDSRFKSIGWVDRSEIQGVVVFRVTPLNEFGVISRGRFSEK